MANRVFDYTEINRIYGEMNKITGDPGDPTTIAGLLKKIDDDYHEVVEGPASENDMALLGDLGKQMLLNWENTSATFPNFVENFDAWSTVVAQAAGDYSKFEQEVQGIRSNNPLGWNSGGITDSYIATSSYADALTEDEIAVYASYSQMLALTNATYVDTGMVAFAKEYKKANIIDDVLTLGTALTLGTSSVIAMKGAFSAGGALAAKMDAAGNVLRSGVGYNKFVMSGLGHKIFGTTVGKAVLGGTMTGAWGVGAAAGYLGAGGALIAAGGGGAAIAGAAGGLAAAHIVDKLVPDNKFNFTDTSIKAQGTDVTINGQDYKYYGHTSNGTQILYNQNGDLVYQASDGSVARVGLINGGIANINNVDEETELVIQGTHAGREKDLVAQEAYKGYFDEIALLSDELDSR